jgi:small-conductance mechanosensitive channel
MIFIVAKHHRHAHDKKDEPKSKLRKLAAPITLIVILAYAAQWAVRTGPTNLAAGIGIAGAAAALWVLHPRKGR